MWQLALAVCCCLVLGSSVDASKSLQCGQNEISKCVDSCPPLKTCRNRFLRVKCAKPTKPCTVTCVCDEGYYRNAIGECITLSECEQCDKPNEFFSCNSACDNECDKIATQNRTNCPYVNIMCNKQCYCDDGYARDSNGDCVPVSECPAALEEKCGENEEYSKEKSSCPIETCASVNAFFNCSAYPPPAPGCVCASGFLRLTMDSPCIPLCECPQMKNAPECAGKTGWN